MTEMVVNRKSDYSEGTFLGAPCPNCGQRQPYTTVLGMRPEPWCAVAEDVDERIQCEFCGFEFVYRWLGTGAM
ncbi:MAG: hypothetical protein HYT13_03325 [Candidatus Liptonbacteria bacterium]|nr:hypothetical protein [Candidatus Liptonbacteria bacterium]